MMNDMMYVLAGAVTTFALFAIGQLIFVEWRESKSRPYHTEQGHRRYED